MHSRNCIRTNSKISNFIEESYSLLFFFTEGTLKFIVLPVNLKVHAQIIFQFSNVWRLSKFIVAHGLIILIIPYYLLTSMSHID